MAKAARRRQRFLRTETKTPSSDELAAAIRRQKADPAFRGFEDFREANRFRFKVGVTRKKVIASLSQFGSKVDPDLRAAFKLRDARRKNFKTIIGVRNLQARRGGTAIGRKTILGGRSG